MALTFDEIRAKVPALFPDNTTESITEADFREMFTHLIDKIEQSRPVLLKADLVAAETYTSESLAGFTETQIIALVNGVEQSTKDGFEYNNGTGQITFPSAQTGTLKVFVIPSGV